MKSEREEKERRGRKKSKREEEERRGREERKREEEERRGKNKRKKEDEKRRRQDGEEKERRGWGRGTRVRVTKRYRQNVLDNNRQWCLFNIPLIKSDKIIDYER